MRNGRGKRRWTRRWTGGVLALLLLGVLPWAAPLAQEGSAVRQIVLGIVSFARWPQPRPQLRLCVVGPAANADGFFAQPIEVGGIPLVPQRMRLADERLGDACDVVYEGPLAPPEREQVVRRLAGHPVLTIGEATPGCIETTMFCLSPAPQSAFSSNLDAIARSGVRLNPRVLLLGRRGANP